MPSGMTPEEETPEAEDPPPPPPPANPNFTLSIHSLVESSRGEHGLLGGAASAAASAADDHVQYRRYCSRRLARLRRCRDVRRELSHGPAGGRSGGGGAGGGGGESGGAGGGGTQQPPQPPPSKSKSKGKKKGKKGSSAGAGGGGGGGGKKGGGGGGGGGGGRSAYHPRPHPSPYDATRHVHYSLVSLYSAERCWSHAMEIRAAYEDAVRGAAKKDNKKKKDAAAGGDGGGGGGTSSSSSTSPAKIRRHCIRRMRRAAAFAAQLEDRARASCDDRTAVEARAYAGWMRGTLAVEVGDWKVSLSLSLSLRSNGTGM